MISERIVGRISAPLSLLFLGKFRSISLMQNVGQTEYIMGNLKILNKEKPMGQTGSHGHSFVILGYSDKG